MNLPTVDLPNLPGLDQLSGVFASLSNPIQAMASDDSIIALMIYIYEVLFG